MPWGLIGTSGYAASSAAPGIVASQKGELKAVLGRDPGRTEQFARRFQACPFNDLDQFLSEGDFECVWIASPTFLHHTQALAALAAGKNVLLEKPFALDSASAWELVDEAQRKRLTLAVGYQARYVPAHIEMARRIADGQIGDVTVARTYYGVHRAGPPPEWRQHRETGRWGAIGDIATHHIDLLRMLLGEISDARSIAAHHLGFETEDVVSATLSFESGALASVSATVNVWTQSTRVEIHGTKGALVATDTSPAGRGSVHLLDAQGEHDITGPRVESLWAEQVDVVTRAAGGEDVAYATGADGARNLEILERIG
jgi:1,5-anhydro-D-fructose reductase (1,5-anhydro-D-mannitol-forming)